MVARTLCTSTWYNASEMLWLWLKYLLSGLVASLPMVEEVEVLEKKIVAAEKVL